MGNYGKIMGNEKKNPQLVWATYKSSAFCFKDCSFISVALRSCILISVEFLSIKVKNLVQNTLKSILGKSHNGKM